MIYLYDIGRDKERHPTLIKLKSYNVKRETTSENDSLISFIRNYLKADQYDNEHMYLIALDLYDRALGVFLLGIGDYKHTDTYKRNVAECLILSGARKFLVVHNHPDGALSLSEGDFVLEDELIELGELFDIEFIGNFVITSEGFMGSHFSKPIYFKKGV